MCVCVVMMIMVMIKGRRIKRIHGYKTKQIKRDIITSCEIT